MQVNPALLRSLNGNAPAGLSRMEKLSEHLRKDRYVRVALNFLERIGGDHMKDLRMEACDKNRVSWIEGRQVVNFGSANFLGLDFDPRLQASVQRGVEMWGVHQYSSRSFYSIEPYEEIERRLAAWLNVEDTLLFPCVTKLHAGVLPALAGKGDVLAVDRFSHNSIWNASRIAAAAGAEVREFDANNPGSLAKVCKRSKNSNCVVVVDGVYSMTGETPPLRELDEAAKRANAILYIDDAHGTGVVGPGGRGAAFEPIGSLRDVLYVGSLSKAFSALGGFITCTPALKLILKMKSDSYIFSGPIPPAFLEVIKQVLTIIESSEHERLLGELRARIHHFSHGLRDLGVRFRGGVGPIVSIVVGDIESTLAAGRSLFDAGYYVQSVIYPAVPLNGGLLRVQINANHTWEAIGRLLEAVGEARGCVKFVGLEGVA
ncbi:MAG: pyridoxal phosphate-dependent aminotransferase family protein [Planctomycetaceae bacterium]|nr:pyridoxal phosphate-dependent aminotransferase family protein [Planctomycetales bacterium]MCB9924482.1 pyridoxal phosphate-dependent aminotransferase family protein [Planctomycetaceae bacterium]